jgi:hypothetical protein
VGGGGRGIPKTSYSSTFQQNNKRSTHIIIRSFLNTEQSQPFVQNDEVDQSKASVSSMSTHVRTPPLWQQEHWRKCIGMYCHTPPIVFTWHHVIFHLFGPLRETLGGKCLEPTINFLCNDGWTSNYRLFWKGHNETVRTMAPVYRDVGRICRKTGITFWKKCD